MKQTCCFTGPRPKNYPSLYTQEQFERKIMGDLQREIDIAIQSGYRTFLSGMALDIDTIAAEIVLKQRETLPSLGIKLNCIIPNRMQSKRWGEEQKSHYQAILARADEVLYVAEKFSVESYRRRNEYMVDKSSLVIAVYVGSNGAKSTIDYAKRNNKRVIVLEI